MTTMTSVPSATVPVGQVNPLAAQHLIPQPVTVAPYGLIGDIAGAVLPTVGRGIGGMFGNAQLGQQVGGFAGQLAQRFSPWEAAPMADPTQVAQFQQQVLATQLAQQQALAAQQAQQQIAPYGVFGGRIGHMLGGLGGGVIGNWLGSQQLGESIGQTVGGALGGVLPFGVGTSPYGVQISPYVSQMQPRYFSGIPTQGIGVVSPFGYAGQTPLYSSVI